MIEIINIFRNTSNKSINYVSQIFKTKGKIASWEEIRTKFRLENNTYFSCTKLADALPCP